MIEENGIRAFSDDSYKYYRLKKDFGWLKAGAMFVYDPDDHMYGSTVHGCLKLCWTPDGDTYSGLCANTVFLHYLFCKDEEWFEEVYRIDKKAIKAEISGILRRYFNGCISSLADDLTDLVVDKL